MSETKEQRGVLSHWGNDLRQTFRTFAVPAGVSSMEAKLLLNHKIPGVSAGYINLEPLWPSLRKKQKKMARFFLKFRTP